jgi:membrane protein
MAVVAAVRSHHREAYRPPARWRRGARFVVEWVKRVWRGMDESNSLGLAAQTAFWLFFSLLPLAAVGGLVLARIAVARVDLTDTLLGSMPAPVRELVTTQLGQVARWNGGAVGPLAAIVFVWLASSGIHSVFDALDVQGRHARPWWKKRLLALGSCVVLSIGIAAIALLGTGLGWLFRVTGADLPHAFASSSGSVLAGVARIGFGALLAFGLIAGLYLAGTPRARERRAAVVPGALVAVSIQALGGFAYGLYVHLLGTGNAYQAGLGIVGVTLTSLYLFCVALLAGAELNRAVTDRRPPRAGRGGR